MGKTKLKLEMVITVDDSKIKFLKEIKDGIANGEFQKSMLDKNIEGCEATIEVVE